MLGAQQRQPGVLIRPGSRDKYQVGSTRKQKRVGQVLPVAFLTAGPGLVRGAAGEYGIHSTGSRCQAGDIVEVSADNFGAQRGKPGSRQVSRVSGGCAHRVAARQKQARHRTEPPGRPRDQDTLGMPGVSARYPIAIVRETHKGTLSVMRTTSAS